jgi:hypothetical protein
MDPFAGGEKTIAVFILGILAARLKGRRILSEQEWFAFSLLSLYSITDM